MVNIQFHIYIYRFPNLDNEALSVRQLTDNADFRVIVQRVKSIMQTSFLAVVSCLIAIFKYL